MCFSAQASFAAAALLSGVGVATMVQAKSSRIFVFATGSFFFGVQQAAEGLVWLSLHGTIASIWGVIGTYIFSFFAYCFWPVIVPYAVYRVELHVKRRRWLLGALALGIAFALGTGISCWWYGLAVREIGHHLVYSFRTFPYGTNALWYIKAIGSILYLCVTVGALCISSVAGMRFLGILFLIAFIVAQIFYRLAFASVWCFLVALLSMVSYGIVTLYVRQRHSHIRS